MIVPQAEIDLTRKGKRTQMMFPMERGECGELLPCVVETTSCVPLQPARFVKGVRVTITSIEGALLAVIDDDHASKQGYRTRNELFMAWRQTYGTVDPSRGVWLVSFVLGDHRTFYAQHRERYLKRKGVGLTTEPSLALKTEPAVTEEEQLEIARKARKARITQEREHAKNQRIAISNALVEMRSLEMNKSVREDIRRIERQLKSIERTLEQEAA